MGAAELVAVVSSDAFRGSVLFLGVVIALVSVVRHGITARKQQTAAMIFETRKDERLIEAHQLISKLYDASDVNMRAMGKDLNHKDRALINYALNHYEYVSTGIQSGIYDEEMLKRASFNTIVRVRNQSREFITGVREKTGRYTIFQELDWLADRWEKAPLKPKKKRPKNP